MAIDDILSKLHGYIFSEQEAEKIIAMVHGRTAIKSKPKTFEKGQTVRIIGPSIGETFIISQIPEDLRRNGPQYENAYSELWRPGYPVSSLELVEEEPDRLATIEQQLSDIEQVNANINHRLDEQKAAQDKLRKRCHDLEERREKHLADKDAGQPQGQTIRILFGGQRSGKLASMVEAMEAGRIIISTDLGNMLAELKAYKWTPPEPAYISKILDQHTSPVMPEPGLRKGDWIRVENSPVCQSEYIGKFFQIEWTGDTGVVQLSDGTYHFAWNLHKLSDAEIARKLNEARPC